MMTENKYKVKDEALFAEVQKLKGGTSRDYNLLYELSEKYIYKIINDIVKNHHTTEDLMQETYLQIYNKLDTLQDAKAFYVWAGRIATNLTLRHVQKYRKETLAVADEEGSTDFVFDVATDDNECFIPENVLMDKEKQRLIAEIIDDLSVEQKLSIQYFYYEEMSVRDIAQAMDCSEGTVKSRLNYARKSIKDAVIDLDVKQGTRLYSLGSLPLFWLVFRESVEAMVLAGTAGATAAVGVAGNVAGAVGGTSSVGTAGAVAGSAGTDMAGTVASGVGTGGGMESTAAGVGNAEAASGAGGAVGGSATTAGGATASAGATAGTAATGATKAATGFAAKFFGTAAGKAIAGIAAAAVIVGGGVAIANQMKEPVESTTSKPIYINFMTDMPIWEVDYSQWINYSISVQVDELSEGQFNEIIYESWYEDENEIQDLFAFMNENELQDKTAMYFMDSLDEYTENKGEVSIDITEDFPEVIEFTLDGMKYTVDVNRVYFYMTGMIGGGQQEYYTPSYVTEYEGEERIIYAMGGGLLVQGTCTCDGDITQSQYAKDAEGNYLHGNPEATSQSVATPESDFEDYAIDWIDPNLEAAMREETGIYDRNIMYSDVKDITELYILPSWDTEDAAKIKDISALSNLTNLTDLNLSGNEISDISALSGLTNLTELDLSNNQISDISALSGLTNLTDLQLYGTEISDISALSNLTNLTSLYLSSNNISDISTLSTLTNLTSLDLGYNAISDISALSGLTNLTDLQLYGTEISDISALSGLTNLTFLALTFNEISDISALSGLTNLTDLQLGYNTISDISVLSGLTNLSYVHLSGNPITDYSPVDHVPNVDK